MKKMADMNKDAIRKIVREVLAANGQPTEDASRAAAAKGKLPRKGPTVLNIFHAGVRRLEEALKQVQLIEEMVGRSSVYTVESARAWVCGGDVREGAGVKCILDTVRPEGLEKVLQRADFLVLPTFCLQTAARVTSLICDDQGSRLVLTALLQGRRILATDDGFMICDILVNPNLKEEIRRILNKLESFGMVFCPTDQLSSVFRQMLASAENPPAAPAGKQAEPAAKKTDLPAERLVTAKVVNTAVDSRQTSIRVAAGGIVTPLARDLAKEYSIQIIETG
ncbi:MAG: hypothetical protein JSW26_15100 [Desulfobacterales bacterium]|nr:MAG: hypothetical protein JSW26_15100 [Desulfobacterales bacterium]